MRAVDAKILDELEMLYGDKDCFYPLHGWLGTAEVYWANVNRLFIVADYAKKHYPNAAEQIAASRKKIVELFQQTKDYARGWGSKSNEKPGISTKNYVEATDESWDALDNWRVSQENLRRAILEFVEYLYSVVSQTLAHGF